jgi:hypothetical protein
MVFKTCSVTSFSKIVLVLLACLGASGIAAAQHVSTRPMKRKRPAHGYSRAAPPIAIPQQTAPPQEAFASFPEQEAAPAAAPSPCDLRLAQFAGFRTLGKLVAPGECGAPDAVLLESVTLPDKSKVAIAPPATLRCEMAEAVTAWLREDVAPTAAKLGSPLRRLDNLGSYECRGRDRVRGATLSEHGRADALDVHDFRLGNGKIIVLADPKAPKDFRDAVREAACARFATVLGPGSDAEHAEHIHLDLEPRRNNYKICEWDVREPVVEVQAKTEAKVEAKAEAKAPIPPDEVPLPRPRPIEADARRRRR